MIAPLPSLPFGGSFSFFLFSYPFFHQEKEGEKGVCRSRGKRGIQGAENFLSGGKKSALYKENFPLRGKKGKKFGLKASFIEIQKNI